MAEPASHVRRMTVEDYLAFEEGSQTRHEFVGGEIHTLAGASDRHNRIAGNIFAALHGAARGSPCRVYMSDMRLRMEDDRFYYPDVMVVCKPLDAENPSFQREPCLLVEVVSPSTEKIDRREKLDAYLKIPSLRAYLIVAQDRMWVENLFRDEQGIWRRGDLTMDHQSFPVSCPPDTALSLSGIYRGIDLA